MGISLRPLHACLPFFLLAAASAFGQSTSTKTFMAAKCQNTVAGAGFSLGTGDAPIPLCDWGSGYIYGVLRFTGNGQKVFDGFPLPPAFSGISAVLTARTASTEGASVFAIETACVGDDETLGSGGQGGPQWSSPQLIVLGAKSERNRHTIGTETSLEAPGCGANKLFLFRLSRDSSTTAENPELVSISFNLH